MKKQYIDQVKHIRKGILTIFEDKISFKEFESWLYESQEKITTEI